MIILVDTNVILDFFLARAPHQCTAVKVFELIYQEKLTALTTASSITDIYFITAKRLGDKAARSVLVDLFNILGVITVTGDDCVAALQLPISDFEDALVSACASKKQVDWIVTNDQSFLKIDKSLAPVISTADFLAQWSK